MEAFVKILVTGGRKFGEFSYKEKQNGKWVEVIRDRDLAIAERWTIHYVLSLSHATYIIQGNAYGADRMAQEWADKNNIQHSGKMYSANWDRDGSGAGPIRNKLMLDDNPDIECVYAFTGGTGTANMIKQSQERGLNVVKPKIFEV